MFVNWVEAISEGERYRRALQIIEHKNPSAHKQGKTECCGSGVCCWRRPGGLNAEDVDKLAASKGVTRQELFKELLVVDNIKGHFVLLPRRKHQIGGVMLGWRETYSLESPCVFLAEDNRCSIHNVKPVVCRQYKCWEETTIKSPTWSEEDLHALGWDGTNPDDYDYECDYRD